MICRNCGKEIPDGSKFCNICGSSQTEGDIQSEDNNEQNIAGNGKKRFPKIPNNQKFMIGMFIIIIAMVVYCVNAAKISSQPVNGTDSTSNDSSMDTNSSYTDENSTYEATDNSETDYGTNLNSDSIDSYDLNGGASEEPIADDEKGACWALAEDVVKANLKSPSSAKFPFSYADDGVVFSKSGNLYTVTGWVDAENSYGAELRSNFTVTMTKSGYGDDAKFTAESCNIE